MTEEKSKVAQTPAEYRGAYKYNLMDENLRAFDAAAPILAQWDDHETRDNWHPRQVIGDDDRYQAKSLALLSAYASRAFHDYLPMRIDPRNRDRVHRVIHHGPQLKFIKAPEAGQSNLAPSAGYRLFGHVHIDGDSNVMTVTLKDMKNRDLYRVEPTPA